MTTSQPFDRAYYRRFYLDPGSRVADRRAAERLGNFVCGYLLYLGLPVRRVLDVGCGLGHWQLVIARHFPRARYVGVEISEYLCERLGWQRGSVVDYRARAPFDLVICQGVLPYLDERDARRAMKNLAQLSRGALYLEAVTAEDYQRGVLDTERSDPTMRKRPARFYQRGLRPSFEPLGGGVFLRKTANVALFALEQGR